MGENGKGGPPQKPASGGKVVSITGEIERRRAEQARARAAASHLRELEASTEMRAYEADLEAMDLEAALEALDQLPPEEAQPTRREFRALRAYRSCLRGDTEAGLAELAEVIAEAPGEAGPYLMRARWRLRSDPAAALADCDAAATAAPLDPNVYARRAEAHVALDDYDRALANYRRAITLDPKRFDAHYSIAKILAARGELAEARAAFDKAIHLAPRYVDFHLGRAAVLTQLGEHVAALRDYDRALALDPSRDDVRSERALCLARAGSLQGAVDAMADLVEGELADDPEALACLGDMRLSLGQLDQAVEAFSRALALAPEHAGLHAKRARAHQRAGRRDLALAGYERASELAPGDGEHHMSRVMILGPAGRFEEAVLAATRAIEAAPNNAAAHALRAIYRSHLEDGPEGPLADLARAVEIAPNDVTYVRKRAEYLMELEELDEALADVDKALTLAPDDAKLHYRRGYCLSRLMESRYSRDLDDNETKEAERERYLAALASLEKAVELGLRDEETFWELACVRESLHDDEGFLAALDLVLEVSPDLLPGLMLRHDRRKRRGDVEGAERDRARLAELGYDARGEKL